jgi:hypothetical protein
VGRREGEGLHLKGKHSHTVDSRIRCQLSVWGCNRHTHCFEQPTCTRGLLPVAANPGMRARTDDATTCQCLPLLGRASGLTQPLTQHSVQLLLLAWHPIPSPLSPDRLLQSTPFQGLLRVMPAALHTQPAVSAPGSVGSQSTLTSAGVS